jgi:hypothetical protein
MQQISSQEAAIKPLATQRHDNWWIEPALVFVGFTLFVIYTVWRAFEADYFEVGPYLSPFFSPKMGEYFPWWTQTMKWSPAILVLWVPCIFRATCYYYRKAYYRAYFMDPPACGVGHLGGNTYCGEHTFPLVLQNIHRYTLYLAIIILGILWVDAWNSCFYKGEFHLGVGSLVFIANCVLLSGYTFGCHAFRHLVGGMIHIFSRSKISQARHQAWMCVSKFNEHHMFWAWISLFVVGFTDFYVRQVACGAIPDITIIGQSISPTL